MDYSILLAKLLGLFLVIISMALLVNAHGFKAAFLANPVVMVLFGGVISVILGVIIVVTHNVWVGWPIIITIIGWLFLIKGILRVGFPDYCIKIANKMLENKIACYSSVIIALIIGLILVWEGFFK